MTSGTKERAMSPSQSSANSNVSAALAKSMHDHWGLYLGEGIVLILLGLAAIIFPFIAGVVATVFLGCQSAFKFDPRSASNFDPLERRGLAVALAPTELVGVAETARARVVAWSSALLLKRQLSLPVSMMSQW